MREDKCKRLLLRCACIQQRHYGMKVMAYTLINLRAFCGTYNSQPVKRKPIAMEEKAHEYQRDQPGLPPPCLALTFPFPWVITAAGAQWLDAAAASSKAQRSKARPGHVIGV
jgi:hypothetical protein